MKREIRGITLFSVLWDMFIFGGFIYANEFAIPKLIQAYEWFFYFSVSLYVLACLCGAMKPQFQYTKAKFHWEVITSILLGIMLAYYDYFVCATMLTFFGYVNSGLNYFNEEKEHGKTF
ncbi:hypothetical protein MUU45_001713 [Rodentibacter pneumotropicus]|uniref:Uncharacterized protein n=1 Tax=Rodentibacter pneumotropicus TaxID=758 RepID=A0AAW5LCW8_9PAST|nr:hypothetical protein [Rodentibacter pneumotropicus]MCQ9121226.1 hypothetical protein [Rodentibacter pneumotropicus]